MIKQYEVALFAASCDKEEVNAEFAKSLDLNYPILSDPTAKTAEAYGVASPNRKFAKRQTFIIGKDGKILAIIDQVKTGSHGAQLVEELERLQVEKR